jgi:tripartite-type tricarboxylate transporter receptor subunit TctC
VLPFPPGGVFDIVGRPWADKVKTSLGTVFVENQPGAGGSVAAAAVAHAEPDGYTIFLGSSSIHLAEMILRQASADRPDEGTCDDLDGGDHGLRHCHPSFGAGANAHGTYSTM